MQERGEAEKGRVAVMDLEQSAFEALRFASAQSLKLYKQPLVITYSGGKDSDVLLRLAENSGREAWNRRVNDG